jgi:hypothetical protein
MPLTYTVEGTAGLVITRKLPHGVHALSMVVVCPAVIVNCSLAGVIQAGTSDHESVCVPGDSFTQLRPHGDAQLPSMYIIEGNAGFVVSLNMPYVAGSGAGEPGLDVKTPVTS